MRVRIVAVILFLNIIVFTHCAGETRPSKKAKLESQPTIEENDGKQQLFIKTSDDGEKYPDERKQEETINDDGDDDYAHPLVLIKKNDKFYLPSQATVETSDSEITRIDYTKDINEEQIYTCRGSILHERNITDKLSKISPIYDSCNFKKEFRGREHKSCNAESIPIVLKKKNGNGQSIKCGPGFGGELYEAAFLYCVSSTWLLTRFYYTGSGQRPENVQMPEEHFIHVYSFCYDNDDSQRASIFTKHRIMAPAILRDPNLEKERKNYLLYIDDDADFNILNINKRVMSIYKTQENTLFKMVVNSMVPRDDMALSAWKNATSHVLNYRAIWQPLKPLMEIIESRIREYAIQNQRELVIYTIALNNNQISARNKNIFMNSDTDHTHVVPVLWGKVVYDEQENASVAIFVHNTPGILPQENNLMCKGKRVLCNISEWNKSPRKITDRAFQYAYCCQVTSHLIQRLFHEEMSARRILNLDTLSPLASANTSAVPSTTAQP